MKTRYLLALSLSSLAFLPACGKDGNGVTGPTTLEITEVAVGTGATAVAGDQVTVDYIGAFLNGNVFDSSISRGVPYTFVLGATPLQVIRGFDQGVTGMRIGGRRVVVIPSDLAYGSTGTGSIPPNTPIQFQIDLLGIAGK
jgi:FKBP-type peptidyl-prolyl cis-trans isomerase